MPLARAPPSVHFLDLFRHTGEPMHALDDALQALLGRPAGSPPLVALRLGLASPDSIRAMSSGEVVRTQTLSEASLEPEPGGLFCERLFGPLGAEAPTREARARALETPFFRAREDDVLAPRERMERFARVTLVAPLEHPLLSRAGWREALALAGIERWTLEVLPVLPPDLRGIVPIPHEDGGPQRFAVSDLNELYRVVIHANARRARLRDLHAPPSILEVEHARLGEAIASLIDNPSTPEPRSGPSGRPLVGLLGMLAHAVRRPWAALAELDGMVARGVVKELRAPLTKRSIALLAHVRALGLSVEIRDECPDRPATVH